MELAEAEGQIRERRKETKAITVPMEGDRRWGNNLLGDRRKKDTSAHTNSRYKWENLNLRGAVANKKNVKKKKKSQKGLR